MHAELTQQEGTGRPRSWNKGRLVGPKPPFKLVEIWAIRIRLQIAERLRDLALFNLAIDGKSCGCRWGMSPREFVPPKPYFITSSRP